MNLNSLFKSVNKLKKNNLIKKECISFFSTLRKFVNDEKKNVIQPIKYIVSELKDIENATEYHDELLTTMIIGETYSEDIIDTYTDIDKVYVKKNRYAKELIELDGNLEKLENSVSEKNNY